MAEALCVGLLLILINIVRRKEVKNRLNINHTGCFISFCQDCRYSSCFRLKSSIRHSKDELISRVKNIRRKMATDYDLWPSYGPNNFVQKSAE
jgi:hypothetical protein